MPAYFFDSSAFVKTPAAFVSSWQMVKLMAGENYAEYG